MVNWLHIDAIDAFQALFECYSFLFKFNFIQRTFLLYGTSMDVAINSHWGIKHNRVNKMNINSFEADKQIF